MATQPQQLSKIMLAYLLATNTRRTFLPFFLMLGVLGFGGCEDSVAPDDIPYVERMVVYGVLTANEPADSIRITRTLPLNTEYNAADAELADVVATIEAGGKQYQLRHIGHGFYNPEGLVPVAGERYTLRSAWHGLSAQATTLIPLPPTIDSLVKMEEQAFEGGYGTFSIGAYVRPVPGAAYSITYDLYDSVNDIRYGVLDNYVRDVWHWRDTTATGHVVVRTYNEFVAPKVGSTTLTGSVGVMAWDEAYYDYYRTYFFGNDDDLFGGGQRTIHWNIEGDGIGLFIGRSKTEVEWK